MPLSPETKKELGELLAKLSTLSEAAASTLEQRTTGSRSPSKVPKGVNERSRVTPTDPDRKPSEGRSLYDWFVWDLERVHPDDTERLEKLIGVGKMKYEQRAVHTPKRTLLRAGTLDNPDSPRERKDAGTAWPAPEPLVGRAYGDDSERPIQAVETEEAAMERVVEWYEGTAAIAVAVNENTTEVWVHKARKKHGRNPDDGRVRPPFLDWDEAERHRQIGLLQQRAKEREELIGARRIAQHFGVAVSTIQRYLDSPAVAA